MNSSIERDTAATFQLIDQLDQMLTEREQRQQTRATKVSETPSNTPSTSKSKSKNRAANMAALQQLMDAYPSVFDRNNMRPLKIGIQEDLIADEKVAKNKIKRALASYVRSLNYIRSIREGVERIDINGQPAGLVTAEEALHAKNKLRDINKQRRQQQVEREREERMSNKLEQLLEKNRKD
ncbi:ProQ/FINO family protein [Marinobacterium arenosum]|uniref:ProQ/FINO family protein n=1 Tax=Marinobacterium arenosum TaxID=2862496 RepID=UPI00210483BA|nr:ProQ/FinO family protein [Marinobacterium arenosum]